MVVFLFEMFGILSETEVRSRYEVKLEKYNKLMNIEVRTMKRMVRRMFLPAINKYASLMAGDIAAMKAVMPNAPLTQQTQLLEKLLAGIEEINAHLEDLHARHYAVLEVEDLQVRANTYAHEIIPVMDRLRAAVDSMEILVDDKIWPVPTYNDILFYS